MSEQDKMKKGLLIYPTDPKKGIFNIGDYIQSLAAAQFFDNIDIKINREALDEYDGEEVKMIFNGWFMHYPEHWPPSNKIKPLFVAFHLNSLAKNELLLENSIRYFKKHEPIGCRDINTKNILIEKGVDAYFSACLTLTLDIKYKTVQKNSRIYFVDPYYEFRRKNILSYLSTIFTRYNDIKALSRNKFKTKSWKNLFKASAFYQQYIQIFDREILANAEFIKHEIPDTFESEEEKFDYAELLLNKYNSAHLVVTSRIHAALPCLALETPVFYTDNVNQLEVSYCRLDGIRELFNTIKCDNGKMSIENQSDKINLETNLKNKTNHIKYRDQLIKRCSKFSKQ